MHSLSGTSVLITGGLGMIGSTVAIKLVQQGAKVVILDALLPLYGGNEFNIESCRHQVELCIADIRDEAAVRHIVRGKDVIFNLAAQVSYTDSVTDPLLDLDINCRGHLTLLEACRQQNLTPRIVFASSRMVYGRTLTCPVNEGHRTDPLLPYAVHKLTGEKYHLMYYRNYGIRCLVARIANPYGPRQQMKHSRYGIVNWFLRQAIEGNVVRVFGDGRQQRDYIYVDDIAEALIALAATDDTAGEVFNVGSGTATAFIDMVHLVIKAVGDGQVECVPWPADYANVETGDYVSDITKIESVTGWSPRIGLKQGIERTYAYYSRYKEHYW